MAATMTYAERQALRSEGKRLALQERSAARLQAKVAYKESMGRQVPDYLYASRDAAVQGVQDAQNALGIDKYRAALAAAPKDKFEPGYHGTVGPGQSATGVNSIYAPQATPGVSVQTQATAQQSPAVRSGYNQSSYAQLSPKERQQVDAFYKQNPTLQQGTYNENFRVGMYQDAQTALGNNEIFYRAPAGVATGERLYPAPFNVTVIPKDENTYKGESTLLGNDTFIRSGLPTGSTTGIPYIYSLGALDSQKAQDNLAQRSQLGYALQEGKNSEGFFSTLISGGERTVKGYFTEAKDFILSNERGLVATNEINPTTIFTRPFIAKITGKSYSLPDVEGLKSPDVRTFALTAVTAPFAFAYPVAAARIGLGIGAYKYVANPSFEQAGRSLFYATPYLQEKVFAKPPVIEEFRFSGVKTDIVGGIGDATESASLRGSAVRSTTIIAEKNILPYSKGLFKELTAQEPDFLVLQGNTRGIVTGEQGTGILADINQPFVIRNPFLQSRPAEVNTLVGAGTPRPQPQFGFPSSDIPYYPLDARMPLVDEVITPKSASKSIVSETEFFKLSDAIAKRQASITGLAQERLGAGTTPYVATDLFFEKFTPRTLPIDKINPQRLGADLFNEQGVLRLQSPNIIKESQFKNVEAPIAQVPGKNIVGRTVQEKITFGFDKPAFSFEFSQESASKIATAFRRPRDIIPEDLGSNPKTPKIIDTFKYGKGNVDPTLSYYPIQKGVTKINFYTGEPYTEFKTIGYQAVKNDFSSIVDQEAAKVATRNTILKDVQEQAVKPSSYAAKSNGQVLLQEQASVAAPELFFEPVSVGQEKPLLKVEVIPGERGKTLFPVSTRSSPKSAPANIITGSQRSTPRNVANIIGSNRQSPYSTNKISTANIIDSIITGSTVSKTFTRNIQNNVQNNIQNNVQSNIQRNIQRQMSRSITRSTPEQRFLFKGYSTPRKSRSKRVDENFFDVRGFSYTPSLEGLSFKPLSKVPLKDVFSGLEIRPVVLPGKRFRVLGGLI